MKYDMAGVRVMLAMPTHRDIPVQTVMSLLETQRLLLAHGIASDFETQTGSSLVHNARIKAAHRFLKSECSHLFWVDSDIAWSGQDFIRLLALGTKMECVSAIYTCKIDPPQFCLNVDDVSAVLEANEHGCFALSGGGLGLGFTVVQRKVIEQLAALAPKRKFPDVPDEPIARIFRCDDDDGNGNGRGEDMSFFADIRALGYRVHLEPTITLGHVGPKEYRASILDYLTAVQ